MNDVECLHRILPIYNTRYVDLRSTLANHLNVHVSLGETHEHATGNANHIAHLLANE